MTKQERNIKNWYLVNTKVRQEETANKNLMSQGFKTFLPKISYELKKSDIKTKVEVMFPGYLFVHIDIKKDSISSIKFSRGVSNLVMFGGKLVPVPTDLIKELKDKIDEEDTLNLKTEYRDYKVGEKVIVKEGILKGLKGTLMSKKGKERVNILISLINKSVTIDMPTVVIGSKKVNKIFKL